MAQETGANAQQVYGSLQVKARGPVRDSDHSIAAHLLRIRDPETGAGLADDLLAGEIGMFFTAGPPSPSLVHLQPHLHWAHVQAPWRALMCFSSLRLCSQTDEEEHLKTRSAHRESPITAGSHLVSSTNGPTHMRVLLGLAGLETSGNQITWIL